MPLDFEKYAMKGHEFINQLAKKLGDETDKDRAGRILRSVFRVIRNHITLEESIQLISQFPMALKGVYVDGWKINESADNIQSLDDLANEVIKEEGNVAWRDFSNIDEVLQAVRAVIETLIVYVSSEEIGYSFDTLPKGLRKILTTWLPTVT